MRYFLDPLLAQAYRRLRREFRGISAPRLIVTAAFGGIDEFCIPPWYAANGFEVVVITDHPVSIEHGRVIDIQVPSGASARLFSKLPKILLPRLARKADLAIWVDANIAFTPSFFSAISAGKVKEGCLTFFGHPESRSPLLEGLYCLVLGKDFAPAVLQTFQEYIGRGQAALLARARINACGILLWRPAIRESRSIAKFWFWLVMTGSIRDQISFPLAVRLARGDSKVISWGLPYNHKDAPLEVRPHVQGNSPDITGWQKPLVSVFDSARRFRKRHFKKGP